MRVSKVRASKSKSKEHGASLQLVGFVHNKFKNKVPVSFLTGLSKTYCKKPVDSAHPFVRRHSQGKFVDGEKLTDYLAKPTNHVKGKPLSEEAIKRVFQNCCNPDGKLSFEYIMKAGEKVGIHFPEKLAKAAVAKYGKKKGFMDMNDCVRVIQKKQERKHNAKSAPSKRR